MPRRVYVWLTFWPSQLFRMSTEESGEGPRAGWLGGRPLYWQPGSPPPATVGNHLVTGAGEHHYHLGLWDNWLETQTLSMEVFVFKILFI